MRCEICGEWAHGDEERVLGIVNGDTIACYGPRMAHAMLAHGWHQRADGTLAVGWEPEPYVDPPSGKERIYAVVEQARAAGENLPMKEIARRAGVSVAYAYEMRLRGRR